MVTIIETGRKNKSGSVLYGSQVVLYGTRYYWLGGGGVRGRGAVVPERGGRGEDEQLVLDRVRPGTAAALDSKLPPVRRLCPRNVSDLWPRRNRPVLLRRRSWRAGIHPRHCSPRVQREILRWQAKLKFRNFLSRSSGAVNCTRPSAVKTKLTVHRRLTIQ